MRLRFEEVPHGWERRNLGGVDGLRPACEFLDSKRVPVNSTERAKRRGPYPYYGANGQQGSIDDFIFDEPLVLLAEDGGFFFDDRRMASYRVNGKCWVNNHAHVLRALPDVMPDWLQLCIGYQDFTHLIPEPSRPKLNQTNAKRVVVPVPPLAEQRRLVARIEALTSRLEQGRNASLAAVAAMDSLLDAAVAFELERAAPHAELVKLGDILTLVQYGTSEKASSEANGVPVLRMGNITDRRVQTDNLKYLQLSAADLERYRLHPGDILINRTNSTELVGKAGVFDISDADYVFASYLIRLRVDSTRADAAFINYVINSDAAQRFLKGNAKEAIGQTNINTKQIRLTPISLPTVTEQRCIVARLDALTDKHALLRCLQSETEADLAAFTPALLAKAFRGEL